MTKRTVMIRMTVARAEIPLSVFDEENGVPTDGEEEATETSAEKFPPFCGELPEPTELLTEGLLVTTTRRVELRYHESEESGMEGSTTFIGFDRSDPAVVSMTRSGAVRTALIFEEKKRHIGLFNTPFSDFEICVHALRVKNELLTAGKMELDYLVEIHGAQAEHCRMSVSVQSAEESL